MEMDRQLDVWLFHFQRSWTGGWVVTVAGLDSEAKKKKKVSCLCQESNTHSFVVQPGP